MPTSWATSSMAAVGSLLRWLLPVVLVVAGLSFHPPHVHAGPGGPAMGLAQAVPASFPRGRDDDDPGSLDVSRGPRLLPLTERRPTLARRTTKPPPATEELLLPPATGPPPAWAVTSHAPRAPRSATPRRVAGLAARAPPPTA